MSKSQLEERFLEIWLGQRGPALEQEFRFNAPASRHRFDFAHLPTRIAIEIEGGTFTGGRHTRGVGFHKDCIKYNIASGLGWRIFRFDTMMLKKRSPMLDEFQAVIRFIKRCEEFRTMEERVKSGVTVLVYRPLACETKESGYVKAAYPLAALVVAGCTYLVDPFGIGTDSLLEGGWYSQPVYAVDDLGENILIQAPIVGTFPLGLNELQLLHVDQTMDMVDFIGPGEAETYRLEQWISFHNRVYSLKAVQQEKERATNT